MHTPVDSYVVYRKNNFRIIIWYNDTPLNQYIYHIAQKRVFSKQHFINNGS